MVAGAPAWAPAVPVTPHLHRILHLLTPGVAEALALLKIHRMLVQISITEVESRKSWNVYYHIPECAFYGGWSKLAKDLYLGPKDVIRLWREAGDSTDALQLAVERGEGDGAETTPSAAFSQLPSNSPEAASASTPWAHGADTHLRPSSNPRTTTATSVGGTVPHHVAWAALPFQQATLAQREWRLKLHHGPPISTRCDKVVAPGQLRIVLNLSSCPPCCRIYFDLEAAKEVMPPDCEVPVGGLKMEVELPAGHLRAVQYVVWPRRNRPGTSARFWSSASWKLVVEELGLNPGDVLFLTRGSPSRLCVRIAVVYAPKDVRSQYYAKRMTSSLTTAFVGEAAAEATGTKQSAAAGLLSLSRWGKEVLPEEGTVPTVSANEGEPAMESTQPRELVHQGWARSRWQPLIDRLIEAGPLSVALRLGSNQRIRIRNKGSGGITLSRLEIDCVTAAAVFPYHAESDTTLVTLTVRDTGQSFDVAYATYSCSGRKPKHYIMDTSWRIVANALGKLNDGDVLRITRPTVGRTRLFISLHRQGTVPITEAVRLVKGCRASKVKYTIPKKRKECEAGEAEGQGPIPSWSRDHCRARRTEHKSSAVLEAGAQLQRDLAAGLALVAQVEAERGHQGWPLPSGPALTAKTADVGMMLPPSSTATAETADVGGSQPASSSATAETADDWWLQPANPTATADVSDDQGLQPASPASPAAASADRGMLLSASPTANAETADDQGLQLASLASPIAASADRGSAHPISSAAAAEASIASEAEEVEPLSDAAPSAAQSTCQEPSQCPGYSTGEFSWPPPAKSPVSWSPAASLSQGAIAAVPGVAMGGASAAASCPADRIARGDHPQPSSLFLPDTEVLAVKSTSAQFQRAVAVRAATRQGQADGRVEVAELLTPRMAAFELQEERMADVGAARPHATPLPRLPPVRVCSRGVEHSQRECVTTAVKEERADTMASQEYVAPPTGQHRPAWASASVTEPQPLREAALVSDTVEVPVNRVRDSAVRLSHLDSDRTPAALSSGATVRESDSSDISGIGGGDLGRGDRGSEGLGLSADAELGPGEYVVERTLAVRRRKRGSVEVLVKWKGYSREEITWEPLENLNKWAQKDVERLMKPKRKRT